jgi:hypothetical protein
VLIDEQPVKNKILAALAGGAHKGFGNGAEQSEPAVYIVATSQRTALQPMNPVIQQIRQDKAVGVFCHR